MLGFFFGVIASPSSVHVEVSLDGSITPAPEQWDGERSTAHCSDASCFAQLVETRADRSGTIVIAVTNTGFAPMWFVCQRAVLELISPPSALPTVQPTTLLSLLICQYHVAQAQSALLDAAAERVPARFDNRHRLGRVRCCKVKCCAMCCWQRWDVLGV